MRNKKYQDLVIKDGVLVGDWENLYKNFPDPWEMSSEDQINSASRLMTRFYCLKLQKEFKSISTLEIGCGFGWMTEFLHQNGFKSRGTDISEECISLVRKRNSELDVHVAKFNDEKHLVDFNPDIIVMNQLTWYVLDEIRDFLDLLRKMAKKNKPIFLIHSLTFYPQGKQTYGLEYFTNLEELKSYFGLNYIFSMETAVYKEEIESHDTMFVAKI
jgi:2-polyprenyl-3-methyl-5-hydroxy-6-metoxy-1,4-benzoquinol methylase